MWEEIIKCKKEEGGDMWCILGDFNYIRRKEERKGINTIGSSSRREIQGFNKFIERLEVVDLPLFGRKYTWYRINGSAKSRLDRVLVSRDWEGIWPGSKQYVLDRTISDHCALLRKSKQIDWGPIPFKTLDVWQTDKAFEEFVKKHWANYNVLGNGLVMLKEKLKRIKHDLKIWNKEVFGHINKEKTMTNC